MTFVEKGSYVRGYGIYAQLPHSFELISQSSYGFPFQQQSTFLGFSKRVHSFKVEKIPGLLELAHSWLFF